jgi:hypothetical protein
LQEEFRLDKNANLDGVMLVTEIQSIPVEMLYLAPLKLRMPGKPKFVPAAEIPLSELPISMIGNESSWTA